MKNFKISSILFFLILIICSAQAIQTVTPEFIRENGKQSVMLLKNYHEFWREHDTRIYGQAMDSTGQYQLDRFYFFGSMRSKFVLNWAEVAFPAEYGLDTGQVNVANGGYTFHFGSNNHRVGFFIFADVYSLDWNDTEQLESYYAQNYPQAKLDLSYLSWDFGGLLLGAFYQNVGKWGIRAGVQQDFFPNTRIESSGQEVFALRKEGDDNAGRITKYRPFFEFQWRQYSISTLWSEAGLQNFIIAPGSFLINGYEWEPMLLWDNPRNRYILVNQLGREVQPSEFFGVSKQKAELFLGTYSSDKFLGALSLHGTLFESESAGGFDAYIGGGAALSYLYPDFFAGAQAGIYLEQIFSLADLNLGYAYNVSNDIVQLGPDPESVVYLTMKLCW